MQTDRNNSLSTFGYTIPGHTEGALQRLWVHGIPPGGFVSKTLRGCLSRDFEYAKAKADGINLAHFTEIVRFIDNEIPEEYIRQWIKERKLE